MPKLYWTAAMRERLRKLSNFKHIEIIIIGISIVTISLMLFFNVAVFKTYQTNLLALQEDHMITTAKAVANGLHNYYDECLAHFAVYFDQYETGERLAEFCKNQKGVSGAATVNARGEVLEQYGISYEEHYSRAVSQFLASGQQEAVLLAPVLTGERHFTQFMITAVASGSSGSRYVIAAIETERIYQAIVQPVQIGENGYSMVKDYSGTILMHKARNQIGIEAIEGRISQYQDYDLDLADLEVWVERQRTEPEGSGIIKSYWWEDEREPVETQKVVAYTRVPIGLEFWIVNCTLDYKEIKKPLAKARNLVLLLTIGIMAVYGLLLVLIFNSISRSRAMGQEMKHLLEMNAAWEELYKREQQIRHNDKMKTLGTMTSMIAHEFNNFLTPIMLYGEMLADNPQLSREDQECLMEIVAASHKAKELTGELSRYGRTEPGQAKKVTVHVAEEIRRSLKMIKKTLPADITLQQQVGSDQGCGLLANSGMINQIVVNLCTNAVHSMQTHGGILSVKGTLIKDNDQMRYGITIEDTGCGMSPDMLNRIFTPFYTTKESGAGTGLGLSVVQDLIHQVSGDINVISVEGKGSRFDLLLPLFEIREDVAGDIGDDGLKLKSIYLIDDNESVGKALERSLRQECRKVCFQAYSERALADIRKDIDKWDIIITDCTMPMMSGLSLAGILRNLGYTGMIILIYGCADPDTQWYLDNGIIQAALEKPVTVQDLRSCVKFLTDIKM